MKPAYTRRYYRRRTTPSRSEGTFFKKESQETFFGGNEHDSFFQPAVVNAPAQSIQRKCEKCEDEDKKVNRMEDKKEEEKKVMRAEDKKEEEKVMKMEDKKEEDKVQRQPEKKEEEKVMKMEDKKEEEKVQRQPEKKEEDKKLMRAEDKKEEEKIQKKETGASPAPAKNISSYISSLSTKGQPLPAQANHFFSSKMGYDFSGVKVHTDKDAVESAKSLNAKAYTCGNNIVFNEGQYNTQSGEGKKLMAHELAHVIQQNEPDKNNMHAKVQRAITYSAPVEIREDPIPKVLSTTSSLLGKTNPMFNGKIAKTKQEAINLLGPVFIDNLRLQYDSKAGACKVNMSSVNLDVSADVQKLTVPSGKWSGTYLGTLVKNCGTYSTVTIEMDSSPSGAAAFEKRIADDEKEHVDDLNRIAKEHFDVFYTYLAGISLPAQSVSECANLYVAEIGDKDAKMILAFLTDWLAAIAVHDNAGGNHHHSTITDNRNCNLVKITANF